VDDGSQDESFRLLIKFVLEGLGHLKAIAMRRNFGQITVISAEIDHSGGYSGINGCRYAK